MKNQTKTAPFIKLAALSTIAFLGAGHLQAALVSQDFTADTIGNPASGTAVINAAIVDGTSTIGSGNAVQLTDPGIAGSAAEKTSYLEYNFVADAGSSLGAVSFSFDIYNNQLSGSTSSFIVGVGAFNSSNLSTLNSSATRAFNLEFRTTDNFLRVRGATNLDGTYSYSGTTHVTVYMNDSETSSITYQDPNNVTQSLASNSGAIYLNNVLLGTVGFAAAYLDGVDAGLGRLGFYSGSSVISQFTLDNIVVTDLNATAIPEPSAFAAILGLGALGLVAARRRRV